MHQLVERCLFRAAWIFGPRIDERVRILGYHSVGEGNSLVSMRTAIFLEQIDWLIRHQYRFLTLSQWWKATRFGTPITRPSVVLTFDEGFRGIWEHVVPALAERRIQATLFVVTDYVGKTNGYHRPNDIPELKLMSWNEMRQLQQCGWDIQSHGRRHLRMTGLDEESLQEELKGSKAMIEQKLGSSVDFFAYPYGMSNERVIAAAQKAGYVAAVTCESGTLPKGTGIGVYQLPRIMADRQKHLDSFTFRFSFAYRQLTVLRSWAERQTERDFGSLMYVQEKPWVQIT